MPRENRTRGAASWLQDVQHACPRCRSAIELTEDGGLCSACGFKVTLTTGVYGFLEQVAVADEMHKTFDDLATGPRGDTSAGVGYVSPVQQRYLIETFRRVCGPTSPDARILDVGCGNGIFWQTLWNRRRAIDIDYSLSMCVRAHARGMIAYHGNALALPFADAQFDLLYSAEMAQCIDDLAALLAEFARVCRPGGRIVVSTSNATSVLRRGLQAARKFAPHPVWAKNRPMIMRTADEMAGAARGLPLKLEMACWTHFPFPWVRCRPFARNRFEWAASNAVVRFVKQPAPA